MGNDSNYTLVLGVKLSLEQKVTETNPKWKSMKDKRNPSQILSKITPDEFSDMSEEAKEKAYMDKNLQLGYVLPSGDVVESLQDNGTFVYDFDCNPKKLCFISNDDWLGDDQLLGIALLHHSTSTGYEKASEKKLLASLSQKGKLVDMINKYGFKFTEKDIQLHQYIEAEG
jgi:hypothetical protein